MTRPTYPYTSELGFIDEKKAYRIALLDKYLEFAMGLNFPPRWCFVKKVCVVCLKNDKKVPSNHIIKKAKQLVRDNKFYLNKFEIKKYGLKIKRAK